MLHEFFRLFATATNMAGLIVLLIGVLILIKAVVAGEGLLGWARGGVLIFLGTYLCGFGAYAI